MTEREQIHLWAERALENLLGGWHALAEHQLVLILKATEPKRRARPAHQQEAAER